MILGEATLRLNGVTMKSIGGAKLDTGGYERKQHNGSGVTWGISEKYSPPSIEMGVAIAADIDVTDLNNTTGATITFDGNNGLSYMLTGCALENPVVLDEEAGEITGMKWLAVKCKRI